MSFSAPENSTNSVISVKNMSKHFLMYKRPQDRLKQMLMPALAGFIGKPAPEYYERFTALKNISLDIGRGETVGIIGRNGSGKSTLLQIICDTLQPSEGAVNVTGRIAALLELGAGFNPDFTGRENVFMNGALIGMSKAEIEDSFADIEAFAGIGTFIDQPTKTYSSGMYVRLAFAVAIHASPDILIVDEALSVGDEAFQRKCFARIERLQAGGVTILFVSHSAQAIVELCDRAVLLDAGEVLLTGRPKTVVSQYQRLINLSGEAAQTARASIQRMAAGISEDGQAQNAKTKNGNSLSETPNGEGVDADALDPSWFDPGLISQSVVAYESKGALIRDPQILNSRGQAVNNLASGRRYSLEYIIDFSRDIDNFIVGCTFKNVNGVELAGASNFGVDRSHVSQIQSGQSLSVKFDFTCPLLPGAYFITAGLMAVVDGDLVFLHRALDLIAVRVLQGTPASPYDRFMCALDADLHTTILED